MKKTILWALVPAALALTLAGCGGGTEAPTENAAGEHAAEEGHAEEGVVTLTQQQITEAGIEVVRPTVGGVAGAIEVSATIEGDPQGVQVASAAIGGRLVSLTRNLGQSVGRGDVLAVIESREAASLKGEIEAARARAALAQSNLRREQRLFAEPPSFTARGSLEHDLVLSGARYQLRSRRPVGSEVLAIAPGLEIATLTSAAGTTEIAMSPPDLDALERLLQGS